MKSTIYFIMFFLNALMGIYFRHDVACVFSILALIISFIFAIRPEDKTAEQNEKLKEGKTR